MSIPPNKSIISDDLFELESQTINKSIISSNLTDLETEFDESQQRNTNNPDSGSFADTSDALVIDGVGERVGITIFTENAAELLPHLEKLGFELVGDASEFNFIEGYLPIEAISSLESLESEGLAGARPMYQPITHAGSATSQADFVHEADRVRAALPEGFDGTGRTIGILSDSYNTSTTATTNEADDIASGDLPNDVEVLEDFNTFPTIDEGRAMAQLIHDLVPGADLKFATAFASQAVFAANINALADAGADIIVDDIGYLTAPFFQDGVVAQAVDEVFADHDVAYFSSAGNAAGESYESEVINFVSNASLDAITGTTGYTFYDFDTTGAEDLRQLITLNDGQRMRISLQWDDPFFAEVDTDLDIFLIDPLSGTVVDSETDPNLVFDEPVEFMVFTDPDAPDGDPDNNVAKTYELVIGKSTGPDPGRIKYLNIDEVSINEHYPATESTVFAHSAATNGRAVAAAPFFDQDDPESFSSFGPTTILFEADGTPLGTPEVRQTPQITAIDGTDTTFFGTDISNDGDGNVFGNFFGTSAAAPHAAAVAALIREANPTWTAQQVYDRLESTAIDITSTGVGFDNVTGFGLINAYDAVFGDVVPASLNFTDNFDDGDLSAAYETNATNAGRIQVTEQNTPQGTNHLTLDTSRGGFDSLNEVILHVDTSGYTDVQLSFDHKEFGDEDHVMSATFTGSEDSDGVALSVDGNNWVRLVDLTGGNISSTYQTFNVDISDVATTNSLNLGSDVQIKFQQFDNFLIDQGPDGFAFDNISVTGTLDGNVTGTSGNDNLDGTAGNDTIPGDAGEDFIEADLGNDIVFGGEGRDILYGEAGDDLLIGGLDSDLLFGGDNNDTLSGGTYNPTDNPIAGTDGAQDSLSGGLGSDTFVLAADSNNDIIYDFEDGSDTLGLVSLGSGDVSISDDGTDTTISFGGDILATIMGVTTIDTGDITTL